MGSLGLGAWRCLDALVYNACVLPKGAEQPNLGGQQLVVGELEQQLLAWQDKDGYVGMVLQQSAASHPLG